MSSLTEFAEDMQVTARIVERSSRRVVKQIAYEILAELVARTPVGGPPTSPHDPHPGLARSNWSVRVGDGGGGAASIRKPEPADATLARAQSVAAGDVLTISNPVPYIGELNSGSSTQAPSGFVETAVETGAAGLAKIEILVE